VLRVLALLVVASIADASMVDLLGYLRAHPPSSSAAGPALVVLPSPTFGELRPALKNPVPNAIEVPVTVPSQGRFRVGIAVQDAYLGQDMVSRAAPVRFAASLRLADGRTEALLARTLDIRQRVSDRRWIDLAVDVSHLAGREATLRLENEAAGPGETSGLYALWNRPLLYDVAEAHARPNLLLVTVDALRADHLGANGYSRPTTPRLDQLAAEGVRFAAAFTSGPMTLPSMGQLFTASPFPAPTRPTLVSSLFAGGVLRTKAIVNNLYLFHWLTLETRDTFDSITAAWSWRADRMTRNALQWVDQRPGEPFALYLHYIDTHTPYRPPPPFATRFTDTAYRGPVGLRFDDVSGARAGHYAPADRARIVALYDAELSFVDVEIGRLLDGLAARGLLDHTLVIVTADHGEEQWDHGSFFHGQSLYDELLHVPLLMRLPDGAYAGRVVSVPVRAVDLVPTIAEVLGLPAFPEFEGVSLLPLIAHGTSPPGELFARAANVEFPYRFALRTPRYKLILTVETGREELYDLASDPGETRDLAAEAAMAETIRPLRDAMDAHRQPLRETGIQVRAVARDGAVHEIDLVVTASDGSALVDPDRIELAEGDRVALTLEGRTLLWAGRIGAQPAGIRFDRGPTRPLGPLPAFEIRARVDGRDLPPPAIYLADGASHPASSPFVYRRLPALLFGDEREEPPLLVNAAPGLDARGSEPVSIFLWRFPDGRTGTVAPALDEAARRRLRALGYVE
jgi:arylsulfatase A-like enzyme